MVPNLVVDFVREFLDGGEEETLNLLIKNIIFINKETSKTNYKRLRPIALANCLLKVVSHVLMLRLESALEEGGFYLPILLPKGREGAQLKWALVYCRF